LLAILILLVASVSSAGALDAPAWNNDYEYQQAQIQALTAENMAFKTELCNIEWRLYEKGLVATPKMSKVCQETSQYECAF
jgi:hypothetical protein